MNRVCHLHRELRRERWFPGDVLQAPAWEETPGQELRYQIRKCCCQLLSGLSGLYNRIENEGTLLSTVFHA